MAEKSLEILASLCAKSCYIDSQAAVMRIDRRIKMHDDIEQYHVVHRERYLEVFSLDLAPLLKTLVHFYSSDSFKLKHTGRLYFQYVPGGDERSYSLSTARSARTCGAAVSLSSIKMPSAVRFVRLERSASRSYIAHRSRYKS